MADEHSPNRQGIRLKTERKNSFVGQIRGYNSYRLGIMVVDFVH